MTIANTTDDVKIILSHRPTIVEAIQRKFKLTQAQVIQYANQFNDHCRIGLTTHKDEQDHLQHFRDWLKIQIQEQKKHGTSNNSSYEQRANEASELVAELLAKCDEVRNEGGVPIDF
jgi:tRNA-dihydrouridine synthase